MVANIAFFIKLFLALVAFQNAIITHSLEIFLLLLYNWAAIYYDHTPVLSHSLLFEVAHSLLYIN